MKIPITESLLPPSPMDDPEAIKKVKEIAQKYGQTIYPPDYLDGVGEIPD